MTEGPSTPEPPRTALSDTWVATVAAILGAISMAFVVFNLQDVTQKNANTASRYATIESLVERGTWVIDDSTFKNTIDRVKLGEHFYSSKPPLLPLYGAGVYWVIKKLTDWNLKDHQGAVVRTISFMTGGIAHLIFLIFFFRILRLVTREPIAQVGGMAAASFAYLGVGYATTINNHSIAAAFVVAGFFYALRAKRAGVLSRDFLYAGLWLGFAPALDLPSGATVGMIAVYMFLSDRRRALTIFLPSLLVGITIHLVVTYQVTGSLLPIYMRREAYDYPGSYWNNPRGIDALNDPLYKYFFHMLLGHHGLFSMTPVLLFGAWQMGRSLRRGASFAWEALVTALPLLACFVFYLFRSNNYGGWCVGMRWFIPFMPFLFLFFALWLDQARLTRLKSVVLAGAFAVSAFHVQDALTGPFQYSIWHNLIENSPNRGRTGRKLNVYKAPRHDNATKAKAKKASNPKPSRTRATTIPVPPGAEGAIKLGPPRR